MEAEHAERLKGKLDGASLAKLQALNNPDVSEFVADAVALGKPDSVKVCDDSPEDIAYIRSRAVEIGEETALATDGHTVHFDGFLSRKRNDQARDKGATKYLVPAGMKLDAKLNQTERGSGLSEVRGLLDGAMKGRQAYVRFFCLGPTDSPFSISCVQVTDSAYVAHSEDLLYRGGYEQLRRAGRGAEFFRFLHSAGRLDERNTSAETDKRRVYIDIAENTVYSVNTQYGGNTIGLKKLALRLAIRKADREGWLAEHMFLMGVNGPGGRVTYFAGAYPSACGKTSTAMLPGERILGDDLAYLRKIGGEARAVNVEEGIFGIIENVNPDDDPEIYKILTHTGEVIFSNVLVADGRPYWIGMGSEIPDRGVNYAGEWHAGMTDPDGNEITPSYKGNARYTVSLRHLTNLDDRLDDPDGVPVGGVIYGGRDRDTAVPVQEAFDWAHGIIAYGASLESESTAATIGAEGVRTFDLMSIFQFLSIPLSKYIQNNLDFGKNLPQPPKVFATNYWLKDEAGKYLNGKLDKAVWIKWMELRVRGEAEGIAGPTGLLPMYEDLRRLFKQVLGKDYAQADYVRQFTIRIPENLAKLDRIEQVYRGVADAPKLLFDTLAAQRKRLMALQEAKGDYVSPLDI
ncbi:MAG TPA: phosphoenolpyruvate carboxykinase (GTP) [Phycisphaerae bacterium]|nr:phosphoenolpyruvate carboxykinase (GTP) [Phycisphaerae bacterium]HUT57131.1 phosphoenolpyruvate carboxykinase (GTP) [Phycisphaerae bacterium]